MGHGNLGDSAGERLRTWGQESDSLVEKKTMNLVLNHDSLSNFDHYA